MYGPLSTENITDNIHTHNAGGESQDDADAHTMIGKIERTKEMFPTKLGM